MKVLKTRRVNIAICWSGLRSTPPKEFPTMGEMESTARILESFKGSVPEFVETIKEGEKLNEDIVAGNIKEKDAVKARAEYLKKSAITEKKNGDEAVEVEFEDEDFNTFFQQFERWGKNWFMKIEPFFAFRKDMNDTNRQPKKK